LRPMNLSDARVDRVCDRKLSTVMRQGPYRLAQLGRHARTSPWHGPCRRLKAHLPHSAAASRPRASRLEDPPRTPPTTILRPRPPASSSRDTTVPADARSKTTRSVQRRNRSATRLYASTATMAKKAHSDGRATTRATNATSSRFTKSRCTVTHHSRARGLKALRHPPKTDPPQSGDSRTCRASSGGM
jgi:hypothetical protein